MVSDSDAIYFKVPNSSVTQAMNDQCSDSSESTYYAVEPDGTECTVFKCDPSQPTDAFDGWPKMTQEEMGKSLYFLKPVDG